MLAQELHQIKERPCKFLFRSGRLVYGVVWEVSMGDQTKLYFSSSGAFNKLKGSDELFRDDDSFHEAIPIDASDIIAAEHLEL